MKEKVQARQRLQMETFPKFDYSWLCRCLKSYFWTPVLFIPLYKSSSTPQPVFLSSLTLIITILITSQSCSFLFQSLHAHLTHVCKAVDQESVCISDCETVVLTAANTNVCRRKVFPMCCGEFGPLTERMILESNDCVCSTVSHAACSAFLYGVVAAILD